MPGSERGRLTQDARLVFAYLGAQLGRTTSGAARHFPLSLRPSLGYQEGQGLSWLTPEHKLRDASLLQCLGLEV